VAGLQEADEKQGRDAGESDRGGMGSPVGVGGRTEGKGTAKVTVRMPVELVKALKHMAIDEGRTFQDLVTEAVRRFLGQ